MESLTMLVPLFTAIIAFCAVLGPLGFIFKLLLNPVKKDIEDLKQGQKELNTKIDKLLSQTTQ